MEMHEVDDYFLPDIVEMIGLQDDDYNILDDIDLIAAGASMEEEVMQPEDVTAADFKRGMDLQGIRWHSMAASREELRDMKMRSYQNYHSLSFSEEQLLKECGSVEKASTFYDFQYYARNVRSTIAHFQLRNLIWANSKHDVYTTHENSIRHWSAQRRSNTEILNASEQIVPTQRHQGSSAQPVSRVEVTTMAVEDDLMIVGGFHGELICKRLDQPGVIFSTRVSTDDNSITNSVEVRWSCSGSRQVVTANNDCSVRIYDAENFDLLKHHVFPWSVNGASVSPSGRHLAVIGDDTNCLLMDPVSGKEIGALNGHLDYSFACAWHPDGHILATGSQDTTCRLWDIRNPSHSLAVLKGNIGSIRGIKFSSDGQFLATAEPIDFVHIYNAHSNYTKSQEVDFFGEVSGLSFSLDTESLFIGVVEYTFGGLLELSRKNQYHYFDYFL